MKSINFLFPREKLQICFVDWGLGLFWHYTTKQGKCYPIIAMNSNMLLFDPELFKWVFEHELDHYKFYSDYNNWNVPYDYSKEARRLLSNPKMFFRLNKFEMTHNPLCYERRMEEVNQCLEEV